MTAPTNWVARPETRADIPAIRAINLAAFETALEADLVEALRNDPSWIEGLSIVSTCLNGKPVGYALMTRCHVDEVPALCLGPCAVDPMYQRSGAGSVAIRAALKAAESMNETCVIVLGHPTYYPRFGFSPAARYGIRLSIDVPGDALMALSLSADPLPSGTVRYAQPFGI
ncbi:GNAT family N-acetyltransferase [Mycolicibacterium goodii]|uniref:GNAT family N-acetyltransferase n=1 Tax=Mycolicibacterium goodii TaxID=134601 RepID=UPI000C258AE5|nr:N-acetyltransferase [Mycolicibacterium goodii]MBU8833283.1 N-acetyltransferase [Mycolicibacterium goodii]PJK18373.1 GNAT family N-acetyltransferase [Mycolicibacterium goodii]